MKTNLIHLCIAITVLAAALVAYGFWYAAIAAESAAVANLESQIEAKLETASRIASARVALAEISGNEATVRSYFVSEKDVVTFIDDLEARARTQKASVTVLSVSTASENVHPVLTMTLRVAGTFEAVMRTVGLIEYAPYYLRVGSLSLGLDAKSEWHADLSIVVGSMPTSVDEGTGSPASVTPASAIPVSVPSVTVPAKSVRPS